MMSEETLFDLLLRIPEAERGALLDRACEGKPHLRARVEALLKADAASSPLSKPAPALDATTGFQATANYIFFDAAPGTLIANRYTLDQKLGEGGMGEVWVAKQSEPVKRKVALKLIKPGMDSKSVLQRFDQERQALALMDHPHIAKVLDGGLTQDRRPFFVMELVNGLPLNKFCDEAKLGIRERLELFVPICQAVQHAHQKGIVHRDLKPSNILVTMIDGKPVPKVIDFGVAKATGGKLTDESMSTQFGAVIGTLEYMSPEQAGFSNQDVDTRADIYSLGVILYELLTGLRPFDSKRLKQVALDEVIRMIREEEPSKPSTKLSTDDSLPSLAAVRHIEPGKLTALLRGELDWVVMKCLEKQRDRRYESANGLARDIQRYLANEAVEARPPSAGYRLRKFAQRNKGKVIAASLVFAALVAGMIGTSIGIYQANRAAAAEYQARIDEASQRVAAEAERKKAIEFRDRAVAALQATTGEDVENLLGEKTTLSANEKNYLESIIKRWKTFADQEGNDEQSRVLQAEGNYRIGMLWQKLGRFKESKEALAQAVIIQEKLCADFTQNPKHRQELAKSLNYLGRNFNVLGEDEKAIQTYRQSVSIVEKLAREYPADDSIQSVLANSLYFLAHILNDKGHWEEAQPLQDQALAIFQRLVEAHPGEPKYRMSLAASHWAIARAYVLAAQNPSAEKHFRNALVHYDKLMSDYPQSFKYRNDSTFTYRDFGVFLSDSGRVNEALELFQKGVAVSESICRDFPGFTGVHGYLGIAHVQLGQTFRRMGKNDLCVEHLQKAAALLEKEVQDHPEIPFNHRQLTICLSELGETYARMGQSEKSLDYLRKALDSAKESDLNTLAIAHGIMANTLSELGRNNESLNHHKQSMAIFEKLMIANPHAIKHKVDLAGNYCNIGVHYLNARQFEEAIHWFNKGIELLQPYYGKEESAATFLRNCYQNRANALKDLDRFQEADQDYQKAIDLSPLRQKDSVRIRRCKMLMEKGQAAEAFKELEVISKASSLPASDWFQLAIIYSLASEQEYGALQIKYANQAVTMLEQAVKRGFNNRKMLKDFSDMPAMKDREDVSANIEEIEKKRLQAETDKLSKPSDKK